MPEELGNTPDPVVEANWAVEYDENLQKVIKETEAHPSDPLTEAPAVAVFACRANTLRTLRKAIKHGDVLGALHTIRTDFVQLPGDPMRGGEINATIKRLQEEEG